MPSKTKTNGASNGDAANGNEGKSLFERIEAPSIPKEAGRKIAQLEQEFIRAEVEQLRKTIPLMRPLYEKRNALIASKELQDADFWPRVFANAPAEIDEYILPSDAAVLGQSLKNLTVERFELDDNGQGEPRSVRLIFDFATGDENPYFENARLVKDFYWRKQVTKTAKGKRRTWEGYVSEPVRINWKEGQDLTKGLLDAACDLFEAEQKDKSVDRTKLPEYETLVKKIQEAEAEAVTGDEDEEADDDNEGAGRSPAGMSFFAFFGYRGRDVSAEQSKEAEKEEAERWAKIEKGEEVDEDADDDDDEDEEEEDSLEAAELFPDGEDLAIAIAEDLWPGALKYYVQSYEVPDDFDSDVEELEDLDEDDEEEGDDKEEEEEERPRKKVKT
ncbi:hypothetical protein VTN77DRAFT_2566 [Rasamsonia byssochlamydoides]|uniref:uncharacterized protein n=1 Tax=Rasamsonia byssochlamydoides TaxID=89139 RepID=UPI003743ADBA